MPLAILFFLNARLSRLSLARVVVAPALPDRAMLRARHGARKHVWKVRGMREACAATKAACSAEQQSVSAAGVAAIAASAALLRHHER